MADFSNAKIGDEVCLYWPSDGVLDAQPIKRDKITKLTQHEVTAFDARWSRQNGLEIGYSGSIHQQILQHPTDDLEAQYAAHLAIVKARHACIMASKILRNARDGEAIRIAAVLPADLLAKGVA